VRDRNDKQAAQREEKKIRCGVVLARRGIPHRE
jgi:hypothetical protein